MFKNIRIPEFVFKIYYNFSDLSFINILVKKGFNVDLEKELSNSIDSRFIIQFIKYFIIFCIYTFENFGSYVTWDDVEYVHIVGNFGKGLGLSKKITFVSCYIGAWVSASPFLIMSIKLIQKDKCLDNLVKILKLITGQSNELEHGISQEMVDKLRKEIKPFIFFIRVSMTISFPPILFCLAYGCYLNQSMEYFTTTKAIPAILWSIFFILIGSQMFWCQFAAVVSVAVICRLITLREDEMAKISLKNACSASTSSSQTGVQLILTNCADAFMQQVKEQLITIQLIRKYNQSLKSILGVLLTYYFMDCTFILFILMTLDEMNLAMGTLLFFYPIQFSVFVIFILVPSHVTVMFRKGLSDLFRESDNIRCSLKVRFKFTYMLKGMRHLDSFDCFDFIPNIQHMFIVWVSLKKCV